MLPGVPFESDDSLNLKGLTEALKALQDAERKLAALDQTLVSVRVWKGRLIATGSKKQAFVYFLPCKRCRRRRKTPAGV